jgi:hypothetical protein
MKAKVSLLIIPRGHYWYSKKALESWGIIMSKRENIFIEEPTVIVPIIDGLEIEIIACKYNNDIRLNQLYEKYDAKFIDAENKNPYNELLKSATGEFICFINPHQALPNGWLIELLSCNQLVERSGLSCITSNPKNKSVASYLDNNLDFVNMLYDEQGRIDGTVLFNRNIIDEIGGFDEYLYGSEFDQYARRLTSLLYNNFYLPDVFGIDLVNEDMYGHIYTKKGYENYDLSIEKMMETRNWKIELL